MALNRQHISDNGPLTNPLNGGGHDTWLLSINQKKVVKLGQTVGL